jgi:hypothetical protein
MQSKVSALPRPWRMPAATAARPSRMAQAIRRFIETSPWDEKLLRQERWIDAGCLALLALSVLYFIPVCLRLLRG